MKTRPYTVLDVFTSRRFAGNPLAVVRDGEGLDTEAMQTIAREFNLPETVFLLPPESDKHRARLRIFTPKAELPFAGHPTVGTAVWLGLDAPGAFVLKEEIGEVSCRSEKRGDGHGFATFDLPKLPRRVADAAEAEIIAHSLSLTLDDLGCDDFAPGVWSAGNAFTMVPVRGLDAIARANANTAHWEAAYGLGKAASPFLFCRETAETGHAFHARMFAPTMGIIEDPATGSALAAFAGLIAQSGGLSDGTHELAVEQGYEMGRPSIMHLTLTLKAGAITRASIGGDAVVVARGEIVA
ncbi:trans-2,3-dihydro-3-hydroxyanthranilate isomerase [Variibacter gotjawalensis]|uniref:Trans-2,3-dihydro-3-hydroxyanthranilate isomerase n=1 Tax=Variibacter gotjawalensis TaxID=1333996 RepID=A0A0S3PTY6_9BRAD|nr:PhzF family phenazine biosynthesis protein [Variibacter gotjawalensis]NIK49690.1 trans-2,3-dihydro-3-hydroxyanthranilate isomerase [Variibacter gotjawalensis]RZS45702.1 trans-2,3-dihydro-3-hydroxyanthranilate isomerase [Variibacter gotjawalensis]BAT59373.1 trans-2,3-dihydro-3-hydroxyanthranilate isomerase [Variibacter gotjawalensis]